MNEKRKKQMVFGWMLLILAFVLPIALELGIRYLNSPKVCSWLVQKSVEKVEKEVGKLIDNNADYHQYEKAGIGLFVYHNDSLLYWNNNLVGPKLIHRKVAVENDTICNLLSGDYYVRSFSKGNLNYYVFKLLNTTYRLENRYFENFYRPFHKVIDNKVSFGVSEGFGIFSAKGKQLANCQIEVKPRTRNVFWYVFLGLDVLLLFVAISLLLPRNRKKARQKPWFKIEYGVLAIILAAVVLTYLYYNVNRKRENREMTALAESLLVKRDATFEASFAKFANDLKADKRLQEMIFAESNVLSDVILGYSKELLFDATMQDYEVTLTICSPDEEITVQPEDYVTNCDDYFIDKLANNKQSRVGDNLYFIDYYTLDPNYLGKIKILSPDSLLQRTLYFEFYRPLAPEGFGFPQLLQEKDSKRPYGYSVANYRENVLVYKYGKYIYPNFFKDQKGKDGEFSYAQGYKHYTNKGNDDNILVISTLRKGWSEITAPFAVFLLGLLIPFLLVCWLVRPKEKRLEHKGSFRQRMQRLVLLTLGVSFVAVGPVSVIYMRSLYNQKTMEAQYETTRTLAIEMSNDLDFEVLLENATRNNWSEILHHYATTFFTDLNLYRLDGTLLATTRQEIYELTLQAPIMNAKAYQNMHRNKALYYTHQERLGNGIYESAYVPMTDGHGNVLAYLNTPYFSSSTDLHNEIKNFVLTYINIILLLLGLALVFILGITKRLTQPLSLIQNKLRDIKIDRKNEPIEWKGNDEIGGLIAQYNQLIVELEKSAAELRRTTTESAWRGVARQVAHEIKNSLTPMRLSVQMLERAAENHPEDMEERVKRTANTIVEQIDALSEIASSFSRYAKLPENHPQPLDLAELVGNLVNLYDNSDNITFNYVYDKAKDHTFNGDKTNLNSAIGNIIKNATQAIGSRADGRIDVYLKATKTHFIIAVKDNGKGIKEEDKKQIFLPNFTTKSDGSGVGLSLTYNIVQAAGGTISFESQENVGTQFTIELPK